MDEKIIPVCVSVVTIGAVLCVALYKDINGAILGAGLTVIGTILGYMFGVRGKPETPPSTD